MRAGIDLSNPMRDRPWRGRMTRLGAHMATQRSIEPGDGWLEAEQASGRRGLSTEAGGVGAVAGFGPAADGRRAGLRANLRVDPVYVVLHRLLGEHQPGGDFAVGVPGCDERHDFGLSRRKAKWVSCTGCRGGPHSTSDRVYGSELRGMVSKVTPCRTRFRWRLSCNDVHPNARHGRYPCRGPLSPGGASR